MATAVGDLVVRLGGDSRGFDKMTRRAQGGLRRLGSAMRGIPMLGTMLTAGGAVAALAAMTGAAKVQEQAERKLAAVLKATGGAAGFSAKELKKYASELQGVTNYGDEATLNAMAMLATFKDIRGDTFKASTEVMLDMSTVLDQDLKSSAIQLGKALNDPIRGVTALSRVGVSFTEQQKEQIKALQESGDLMGAQSIILRELQSEFGGAARAMADPMVQLKNALGDIGEKIGEEVLPFARILAKDMTDALSNSASAATDANHGFSDFALGVFEAVNALDWLGQKLLAGQIAMSKLIRWNERVKQSWYGEDDTRTSFIENLTRSIRELEKEQTARAASPGWGDSLKKRYEQLQRELDALRNADRAPRDPGGGSAGADAVAATDDAVQSLLDKETTGKAVEGLLDRWQAAVNAFGKTSRQQSLEDLLFEAGPGDSGKIEALRKLDEQLTELEKRAEATKLIDRMLGGDPLAKVEQIRKQLDPFLQTPGAVGDRANQAMDAARQQYLKGIGLNTSKKLSPQEQLAEVSSKIDEAIARGLMTFDEGQRAMANAESAIGKQDDSSDVPRAGAMARGSADAFRAILASGDRGGKKPEQETAKNTRKIATAAADTADAAKELVRQNQNKQLVEIPQA